MSYNKSFPLLVYAFLSSFPAFAVDPGADGKQALPSLEQHKKTLAPLAIPNDENLQQSADQRPVPSSVDIIIYNDKLESKIIPGADFLNSNRVSDVLKTESKFVDGFLKELHNRYRDFYLENIGVGGRLDEVSREIIDIQTQKVSSKALDSLNTTFDGGKKDKKLVKPNSELVLMDMDGDKDKECLNKEDASRGESFSLKILLWNEDEPIDRVKKIINSHTNTKNEASQLLVCVLSKDHLPDTSHINEGQLLKKKECVFLLSNDHISPTKLNQSIYQNQNFLLEDPMLFVFSAMAAMKNGLSLREFQEVVPKIHNKLITTREKNKSLQRTVYTHERVKGQLEHDIKTDVAKKPLGDMFALMALDNNRISLAQNKLEETIALVEEEPFWLNRLFGKDREDCKLQTINHDLYAILKAKQKEKSSMFYPIKAPFAKLVSFITRKKEDATKDWIEKNATKLGNVNDKERKELFNYFKEAIGKTFEETLTKSNSPLGDYFKKSEVNNRTLSIEEMLEKIKHKCQADPQDKAFEKSDDVPVEEIPDNYSERFSRASFGGLTVNPALMKRK